MTAQDSVTGTRDLPAGTPMIEEYTGVLAAADVFSEHTAGWVMESVRLDKGYGSQVHP